MAVRFHIGAKQLRGELSAYAKRFDLLEVQTGAVGAKGVATVATLRRWRKQVPPHFEFVAIAGPALSKLVAGDAYEAELAGLVAAVEALQARSILIPTPMEVTPGKVWRDRMTKLLARLPRDASQVAWEPRGVWEIEDAAVAAVKWGIVLVVDPTRDPVPAGSVVYARLPAIGETRSYGAAALERVIAAIGDRRDAYVVLETATALEECKRLRTLAQGVRKVTKVGGGGRLIRPRGAAVRVKDDEQE
jgi:uncharacterized protein YecE (DUF72 family)